jgi:hypothetical protein
MMTYNKKSISVSLFIFIILIAIVLLVMNETNAQGKAGKSQNTNWLSQVATYLGFVVLGGGAVKLIGSIYSGKGNAPTGDALTIFAKNNKLEHESMFKAHKDVSTALTTLADNQKTLIKNSDENRRVMQNVNDTLIAINTKLNFRSNTGR